MMGWRQKRRYMRFYNSTAHIYDLRYSEEQLLKIGEALESLKLERKSSVLDMGCGTCLLTSKIHSLAGTILCLDVSKSMLREAKSHLRNLPKVHLVLADADNMPFREGYFDVVFAITLLQNMPIPFITLEEMKRVSKHDAQLVVTGLKKCFTDFSFLKLLEKTSLKVEVLRTDEKLKCYVAKCKA